MTNPRGVPDNLPGYGVDAAVARAMADPNSAAANALKAAFIAGRVYNSDGSTNATKRLHVKLTADGLDIDDLFIEDVA